MRRYSVGVRPRTRHWAGEDYLHARVRCSGVLPAGPCPHYSGCLRCGRGQRCFARTALHVGYMKPQPCCRGFSIRVHSINTRALYSVRRYVFPVHGTMNTYRKRRSGTVRYDTIGRKVCSERCMLRNRTHTLLRAQTSLTGSICDRKPKR
jgi:hypothetical protein